MATPSADEAVKVQTVLDFLKGTFPGTDTMRLVPDFHRGAGGLVAWGVRVEPE